MCYRLSSGVLGRIAVTAVRCGGTDAPYPGSGGRPPVSVHRVITRMLERAQSLPHRQPAASSLSERSSGEVGLRPWVQCVMHLCNPRHVSNPPLHNSGDWSDAGTSVSPPCCHWPQVYALEPLWLRFANPALEVKFLAWLPHANTVVGSRTLLLKTPPRAEPVPQSAHRQICCAIGALRPVRRQSALHMPPQRCPVSWFLDSQMSTGFACAVAARAAAVLRAGAGVAGGRRDAGDVPRPGQLGVRPGRRSDGAGCAHRRATRQVSGKSNLKDQTAKFRCCEVSATSIPRRRTGSV